MDKWNLKVSRLNSDDKIQFVREIIRKIKTLGVRETCINLRTLNPISINLSENKTPTRRKAVL